jgi:ComF family protein
VRRSAQGPCGACLNRPPAFDATLALADYAVPLDMLVIGLKYHARLALAGEFARRLHARAGLLPSRPELIVPVPLAGPRLAQRGYNQAWEIARPLARMLHVRASAGLVERVIDTPPQARLDAQARRRNVRRAFAVTSATGDDCLNGRHVGVVDDVMTSGATLDALGRLLKRAGAARITNFVVLRTDSPMPPCSTSSW